VRGDHLGSNLPEANAFCNANTRHAKVCTCFILHPTRIELNSSSLDILSSSTDKLLWRMAALAGRIATMQNGPLLASKHKHGVVACGRSLTDPESCAQQFYSGNGHSLHRK
jgi:hypothetical protein